MILVIDNYDSFVHTIANYLRELGANPMVRATMRLYLPREAPEAIVISQALARQTRRGSRCNSDF